MTENNTNRLDIILACDYKYIYPMMTFMNSILTNASKPDLINFNIVCDDEILFQKRLELLRSRHQDVTFNIRCTTLNVLSKQTLNLIKKYSNSSDKSIYNFCRFWFHDIFPDLDYVIYLDIDMIIEGDIFELANFKFTKSKFLASVLGTASRKTSRYKNNPIHHTLLKKYNITQEFIDLIIKIDELTDDEVRDLDYMEDRIQTHLEL